MTGFVYEIGAHPPDVREDGLYDTRLHARLDALARVLCSWCQSHPSEVRDKSLEFQIWWRDHQKHDAEREAREAEQRRRDKLRDDALAKLTQEELDALLRR
jgi:hypothetical protein